MNVVWLASNSSQSTGDIGAAPAAVVQRALSFQHVRGARLVSVASCFAGMAQVTPTSPEDGEPALLEASRDPQRRRLQQLSGKVCADLMLYLDCRSMLSSNLLY